jgi:hypothetical protein
VTQVVAPLCSDVTVLQDWSVVVDSNNAGPHTTNYSVATGSDSARVLVVSVGTHSNGNNTPTFTVSYGGRPLTKIFNANTDGASPSSGRAGSWIGYLAEAELDLASGTTLSVQSNDSGATTDGIQVRAMLLDNVQQDGTNGPVPADGIGEFQCNSYDSSSCTQSNDFTYDTGDMTVVATGGYSGVTYSMSNNDDPMTNVSGADYGVAYSMDSIATATVTETNITLSPSGNGREMGAAVVFQSSCNNN